MNETTFIYNGVSVKKITVDALVSAPQTGGLFQKVDNVYEKTRIRMIPYFAFANRGESDMLVWLRYKD